ncbi:MAG: tyrosine-type recombinase/integrase [Lachnospiraceae bacterium]|nr:tyrosine-type recombinase/integrase [Lachnospiraceae bacterium]
MDLEETELLFSIPDRKDPSQYRDLAIMTVMYESGARVQEVIDLCPSNFHFSGTNRVEIHGKGNKTRLVSISRKVAEIVKTYIKKAGRTEPKEPLFVNRKGEKLTRAGIQYIINKYVDIARSQRPDLFKSKITNHTFRHSKAMHLLEADVNLVYIRDFLGHTSVKTTEIYARSNPKVKEEQLRKSSAAINSGKNYGEKEKENLLDWLKKNL